MKNNPYVHKFSRSYFRSHGKKTADHHDIPVNPINPGLKLAGIIMIACIAVPLLLMDISFIAGLITK